jgi:hypothetical protein
MRALWGFLVRVGGPVGAIVIVIAGAAAVVALALGVAKLATEATSRVGSGSGANACENSSGARAHPVHGSFPSKTVVLTPAIKDIKWAFDASRGAVAVPIVIGASPPLTGLAPAEIEVLPSSLVRADNHARFPKVPSFSEPQISGNGEQITFELCLDPTSVQAGSYAGSVFVDVGRANVAGTTIAVHVTARSPGWFALGFVFMLVAIAVVLTLKGVADYRRSIEGTSTTFNLGNALGYIWSPQDLRVVTSLVGIGAAIFVGLRIYNTDHTWGDDAYQDSVALVAAAIAAVGAQGIFDGLLGALKGGT